MKQFLLFPVVSAALSLPLHAQTFGNTSSIYDLTLKELMEVSVITAASDFEQSRDQVFAAHTVITKEEWQAFGATILSEALVAVPGLHVGKSVLSPSHHNCAIRGLGGHFGEQIRLMIDGKPLERKYNGGRPFGFNLPLGSFKRIEVVRGPGSAVYGADAYAGVINLVTTDWEENTPAITAGTGSFGFNQLSLQQSLGDENHHFLLSIDYMTYDDDPKRIISRDIQSQFDEIFNTQASQAPGPVDEHFDIVTLNANWRRQNWSFDYFSWRNFDSGLVAGAALALDNQGTIRSRADVYTLDWALGEAFGWDRLNVTINYQTQANLAKYHLFPAGATLPIGSDGNVDFANPTSVALFEDGVIGAPDTYEKYFNIKITQVLDFNNHKIRWQVGYQKDRIETEERKNFGPGVLDGTETLVDGQLTDVTGTEHIFMQNRHSRFYFLSFMDQWQISNQWLLNIGARYDHYSIFGSTTNPRLGLIYQARPEIALKFFAGSAFRAPSFSELYVSNNPVTIGNEALAPESVDTLETGFGLEYFVSDNLLLTTSLYKYHAQNLINFEFEPELQLNLAQNTGEQKGQGLEFSMRHKPRNDITLQLNYAYFNGQDHNDNAVAHYPGNLVYASMNWQIDKRWNWSIDAKWLNDRRREADDNREPVDDYLWFNTTLIARNVLTNLDLTLTVKNLFDTGAREPASSSIPDDFPLPGRFWSVALKYRF